MNKEDLVRVLKMANCDANSIAFAINAWEMGAEWEQEQCAKLAEDLGADGYDSEKIAYFIRARKPLNVFTMGETIHRE
jgi:hypothetical protein